MMRKIVIAVVVGGAALLGAMNAPAQAQNYPNVADRTAFTQPANYMSLPGLLRFEYMRATGRWISREEAVQAAKAQGANVGPAPVG